MPAKWIDNAKFVAVLVAAYLLVMALVTLGGMMTRGPAAKSGVLEPTPVGVGVSFDPETGCQYLVTSAGGITPRLAPDGTQICGAPEPLKPSIGG